MSISPNVKERLRKRYEADFLSFHENKIKDNRSAGSRARLGVTCPAVPPPVNTIFFMVTLLARFWRTSIQKLKNLQLFLLACLCYIIVSNALAS